MFDADLILKKAKAGGASEAEIFITNASSFLALAQKEDIDISASDVCSAGLRVAIGKKIGFASTSDENNIGALVENALKTAKHSKENRNFYGFCRKIKNAKVSGIYSKKLASKGAKELVEATKEAQGIKGKYSRAIEVISTLGNAENIFATSEGAYGRFKSSLFHSEASFLSKKGNARNSVSKGFTSRKEICMDFAKDIVKYADDIVFAKKPRLPKALPVIMNQDVFGEAIENTIKPNFLGENINEKKSCLAGKLGRKIFSEKITIKDSGVLACGISTSPFDREGQATQETMLVENGVLKNFAYDLENAKIAGKKTTGNAVGGAAMPPDCGFNNFIVSGETEELKEILENIKTGLYIINMLGGHTADHITGQFSFGVVFGYLIKNGKLAQPVTNFIISGNMFELLSRQFACFAEKESVFFDPGMYGPNYNRSAVFNSMTVIT